MTQPAENTPDTKTSFVISNEQMPITQPLLKFKDIITELENRYDQDYDALINQITKGDLAAATPKEKEIVMSRASDLTLPILLELDIDQIVAAIADGLNYSKRHSLLDLLSQKDLSNIKAGQVRELGATGYNLDRILTKLPTAAIVRAIQQEDMSSASKFRLKSKLDEKFISKLVAVLVVRSGLDKINQNQKLAVIKSTPDNLFHVLLEKMKLDLSTFESGVILKLLEYSSSPIKNAYYITVLEDRQDLTVVEKFKILQKASADQVDSLLTKFNFSTSDIITNLNQFPVDLQKTLVKMITEDDATLKTLTAEQIIKLLYSISLLIKDYTFLGKLSVNQILDTFIIDHYVGFSKELAQQLRLDELTTAQKIIISKRLVIPNFPPRSELVEQLQVEDFKLATTIQRTEFIRILDGKKLEDCLAQLTAKEIVDILLLLRAEYDPPHTKEGFLFGQLLKIDLKDLTADQRNTIALYATPEQLKSLIENGFSLDGLSNSNIIKVIINVPIELLSPEVLSASAISDTAVKQFNWFYRGQNLKLKTLLEQRSDDLSPYQVKWLKIQGYKAADTLPILNQATYIKAFQSVVIDFETFKKAHATVPKEHVPHNLQWVFAIDPRLGTDDEIIDDFLLQTEGGHLKHIFKIADRV